MLILIRHGKPEMKTGEKIFLGRTDMHIDEEGRKQMETVAAMCPVSIQKLWVSTSSRCRESADVFLKKYLSEHPENKPEIHYMDELQEINMGQWDGKSFEEIKREYPLEYEKRGENLAGYCVPGGESFLMVQKRAVCALQEILRNPKENHVLITHLGVMRTLYCCFKGLPLERLMEWKCGYGEMLIPSDAEIEKITADIIDDSHEMQLIPRRY